MPFEFENRDTDKLGRDYDKQQQESEGGGPKYFLKNGRTILRVLPAWKGSGGRWYYEFKEHYFDRIGEDTRVNIPCPTSLDERCPLCEHGQVAYDSGDIKTAKMFNPSRKFLFNVIVLSDQKQTDATKGVKVLQAGPTVQHELLSFDMNADAGYGDITNLAEGFNVVIERTGEKLQTRYSTIVMRERTNIVETLAGQGIDINTLNLYALDKVPTFKSLEELEEVVKVATSGSGAGVPVAAPSIPTVDPAIAGPVAEVPSAAIMPPVTVSGPVPTVPSVPTASN